MKLPINKFSFSGKLIREEQVGGGKMLYIEQLVGGKMLTILPVAVKDENMPPHLKAGSEVYVGNARLSRTSKREIFIAGKAVYLNTQKAVLNEVDVTGIVTEITCCDGGAYIISIMHESDAGANFQVMAGSKAFDTHHITPGDEVLILGGTIYQKENGFWIRVTDPSQLILIERGNPDKGIIQAKDKFI